MTDANTRPLTAEERKTIAWMRARPLHIQKMMRHFPPGCEVRAAAGFSFVVPMDGGTAEVIGYQNDGSIAVACRKQLIRSFCDAEGLDVASHWRGADTEWVDRILAGEDLPWPLDIEVSVPVVAVGES